MTTAAQIIFRDTMADFGGNALAAAQALVTVMREYEEQRTQDMIDALDATIREARLEVRR
jgi:hypothetical protein